MKHFASIFAITVTLLMAGSLRADPIYPDVANTSHATPEVTTFFKSYFTAKSEHKPVPTTDHFSEAHLTYIDATLGWPFYNKKAMIDIFEMYMPKWPSTGLSYLTRITGDTHSALVAFTDTPELFGGEIRILAAVDFKDSKVVRWIDYWDGRPFGVEPAAKAPRPRSKTCRKSWPRPLPRATPLRLLRYSPTMRSTSTGHCGCASLANRRSAGTSRACWRRHHTARAQSSCTSSVVIRAAASSGRTTEAR